MAYQLSKEDKPTYALEGSVAYAGATLQWCRDNAEMITDIAADIEQSARDSCHVDINDFDKMEAPFVPEEEDDVYFVPAFSGLFAPFWRSDARGLIVGLTAYHGRNHILRAALESTAFSVLDVIEAMHKDISFTTDKQEPDCTSSTSGSNQHDSTVPCVKVDGGMTNNSYLMQFQANMLNSPVHVPENMTNMTALGAIYAAGIGCGYFNSDALPSSNTPPTNTSNVVNGLKPLWQLEKEYTPHINKNRREVKVNIPILRKYYYSFIALLITTIVCPIHIILFICANIGGKMARSCWTFMWVGS